MSNFIKPIITEKSMSDAARGVFTFRVSLRSTKHELKSELEQLFPVHVLKVSTRTIPSPAKRTGRRRMLTPQSSVKYAQFWLKKGENISLFDLKEE
jgi:large subunit ribosomal protein L23